MTCPRCTKYHRRAQLAEAALAAMDPERLAQAGRSGGSIGRALLTWQATKALEEREDARAKLSAAARLCRIYFEIAEEAIGEEEVRRRRDARMDDGFVEQLLCPSCSASIVGADEDLD